MIMRLKILFDAVFVSGSESLSFVVRTQ